MRLPEFIKRYHNSLPNELAQNLFGETVGEEQDIAHPNAYFMVLFHQVKELKHEVSYLRERIQTLQERIDNE